MPARYRSYSTLVRDTALVAMRTAGHEMAPKGVAVTITVWWLLSWPKSASIADRESVAEMTGQPDADNCLKTAMDALTGIVYADDAQITDAKVKKRRVPRGREGLNVVVSWEA